MGLLKAQHRPKISVPFVLQVLSAVVRSIVLPVRVDPGGHSNALGRCELDIVVTRIEVGPQLAGIGPQAIGW